MSEIDEKIDQLEKRLDDLIKTQIGFQQTTNQIRYEIGVLRTTQQKRANPGQQETYRQPVREFIPPHSSPVHNEPPIEANRVPSDNAKVPPREVPPPTFGLPPRPNESDSAESQSAFSKYATSYAESARANLEEFIGENLISKIGIIILVLGIGIGVKYAIDNNLISPLTRIIVGYIFGFGLIGLAIRLKPKYLNFSAVLLSGGMAAMYFVTYFAYSLYGLISQPAAFALMAMFTVFTVAAASVYSRQIIAHLGLVGAYAVPFLLSNNSGNYTFLFSYISIINVGVLAVSIKRYWKPIFYTSFGFTWLIFYAWFITKYSPQEHFGPALLFLGLLFAIFYATRVIHGRIYAESGDLENLVSVLATAFVFYAFSLAISNAALDTSRYAILFAYIAAITLAVVIVSFRYYGKAIIYLAYPFTWLSYGVWFSKWYNPDEHFALAAVFAVVFFAIFYAATLAIRLFFDDLSLIESTSLILTNSFIFYGFGYSVLSSRESFQEYLGLYTAAHAAFHYSVARLSTKLRSSAADVGQVLAILVLTFATIAIPVQFDGNRVTMIWSVEAALLFWFGRTKQVSIFEYYSYPVMLLATGSMFVDWIAAYAQRTSYASEFNRQVFANGDFITALVLIAALAFMFVTNRDDRFEPAVNPALVRPIGYALAAAGLFALYNTFRIEISNYFHMQMVASWASDLGASNVRTIADLGNLNTVWQMIYTMLFLTAASIVNQRKVRSAALGHVIAGLSVIVLFIYLTIGMGLLFELGESYVATDGLSGTINIAIRYISYLAAACLLYALRENSRDAYLVDKFSARSLGRVFDGALCVAVLIAASSELINLMAQYHIPSSYKFGLSVLWGVYALALIAVGIARYKKHLRIGAMVLLGVTLAKLFLYDVADLPTIPKTILFVSLGILMLIVSFLYTKYKFIIFDHPMAEDDLGE